MHLRIASQLETMGQVLHHIEKWAQTSQLAPELIDRLVMVASEALSNAICHGNQLDPSKQVQLFLEIQGDVVELCVEDEGSGFDRTRVARYDPENPQMLFQPHGRGLYLIEALADEVLYENGGRRIRMRLRPHS